MTALRDIGFLALGFGAGLLHFHLLRWNTRLFVAVGAPWAIGAQVLRLAALALVLLVIASHGAAALLFAAFGVMLARQLVLRRARTMP